MSIENRQTQRIRDFARAQISELSQLPCFLEDVSKTGCKIRCNDTFEVDLDREYALTIIPAPRSGMKEFSLIVSPQWVRKDETSVEIGFAILLSPGMRQYTRYVETLAEQEAMELQEA